MKILNHFTDILRGSLKLLRILAPLMLLAASGCDSVIYNDEGDCDPHYKVRFIYDRNLKYTDAFAAEVEEVTLYIADKDGRIVWQKHEAGEALRSGSYLMDVEGLEPGTYSLLAWCGAGHATDFAIASNAVNHRDLQANLTGREGHAEGFDFEGSGMSNNFRDLYHGYVGTVEFPDEQGVHVYTVPLTKDTNDVHIVLQNISGQPLDVNDFLFTIVEENGLLDWDNKVLADEKLTYYPHTAVSGQAGVDVPDYQGDGQGGRSRTITSVSCAVADFQTSRITPEQRHMVRIYRRADHYLIASLPLADYALMTKGRHRDLSDDDYLDYRDDYSMVLFLDENGNWISTRIYINSWQLVLQSWGE